MASGERKWQVLEDLDFIGSTTPADALAGYYEFTDGVLLVCQATEESSGDSGSGLSRSEQGVAGDSWDGYDEIPF